MERQRTKEVIEYWDECAFCDKIITGRTPALLRSNLKQHVDSHKGETKNEQ